MNLLGRDIKPGEEVVLKDIDEKKDIKSRIFICEGGNGMRLNLPGSIITGRWKARGETGYIRVEHIDLEATKRIQGRNRMFDGRAGNTGRTRRSNGKNK